MTEHKENKFVKGTMFIAVGIVLVKFLGAVFRIPLANIIGEDGMAYYGTVYPIYTLLYTVATLGVPVAISKLTAEKIAHGDYYGAKRILTLTTAVFGAIGIVLFFVTFFFADQIISIFQGVDDAVIALRAISPALIFLSLSAILRGYFQGFQNMKPTMLSQIVEQVARVCFGLFLALYFLEQGTDKAAGGATFGACAGAFFSLLFLFFVYTVQSRSKKYKQKVKESYHSFEEEKPLTIVRNVFSIALPATVGSIVMPLMSIIDLTIITNRLADIGFTNETIRALYGGYSGFVFPLVNMPIVVIGAIAVNIVPAIASAVKLKNKEEIQNNITLSFRMTTILSMPFTVGFLIFARQMLTLLFPAQLDVIDSNTTLLMVFALALMPIALIFTFTGILQGLTKQFVPVVTLLFGAVINIFLSILLAGMPSLNIKGAIIATVITYYIVSALDLYFILKVSKVKLDYKQIFIKPLVSSVLMGIVGLLCLFVLNGFFGNSFNSIVDIKANNISLVISGLVCIVFYFVIMYLIKGVTKSDLKLLPWKRGRS